MFRAVMEAFVLVCVGSIDASAQASWCAGIERAQVGVLLGGAPPTPMQSGPTKDAEAGRHRDNESQPAAARPVRKAAVLIQRWRQTAA